ncbi:Calcineurin-like phosphoesterase domain [Trypanosoma melophagium]|uniref:Calcineurin-like phosphoesterase domain n=1 Tax=Trypanosoma melophagium TaxID=715481 RepID=UPI003519DFBE|nr:Calcineurin-like phosphoesterase domain [Trypanosoma melophagium]
MAKEISGPDKEALKGVPECINGAEGIINDTNANGNGSMRENAVNLIPLGIRTESNEKVPLGEARRNSDPRDVRAVVEAEREVEGVIRVEVSPVTECEVSLLGVSSTIILTHYSSFFSKPPLKGVFTELIGTFIQAGMAAFTSCDIVKPDGDISGVATSSWNEKIRLFLTMDVVDSLCHEAHTVLEAENALLDIHVSSDETLVVVGDIHGQLSDMFRHDRKFLFLGDYVDRGPCGVEVVMLLLVLKVEYPHLVYMIRGNHEVPHTSRIYGFYSEVQLNFAGDAAWVRFNEVFCFLPLAAVVSTPVRRFFAVHGGLAPPLAPSNVDLIAGIERCDYGNALDNVFSDALDVLLWSDPGDNSTAYARNVRGCGYVFGSSASHEFCERNHFDFICRAHQVISDGYAWTHDGRVVTVFSVPNYCGFNNNLGAIMTVQPSATEAPSTTEVGDNDNLDDIDEDEDDGNNKDEGSNDEGNNAGKGDDDDHNGDHDDESGKNKNEGDSDNRNHCNGDRSFGDLHFIQFASVAERSPPSIPTLSLAPEPKPCGEFVFADCTE